MADVTVSIGRTSTGVNPIVELTGLDAYVAETLAPRIVAEGAPVATQAILDTTASIRGTLSMSGFFGALEIDPEVEDTRAQLTAYPYLAWLVAENGTKPHRIPGRGSTKMPTPYGIYHVVHHPGATGTPVWAAGCEAATTAVDELVDGISVEDVLGG